MQDKRRHEMSWQINLHIQENNEQSATIKYEQVCMGQQVTC